VDYAFRVQELDLTSDYLAKVAKEKERDSAIRQRVGPERPEVAGE
jgi:hypothetical protein